MNLDLKDIPRERWAGALAMVLINGFQQHPDVLLELICGGEQKFVQIGSQTDVYGITKTEYKRIFRKLKKKATEMGLIQ